MKRKIIILVIFLVLIAGVSFARELEVPLPTIGTTPSIETTPLLPAYIRYIFNFAIGISGLIAFLMIIYGGVRHLISAGNPTARSDANDQIFSAVIGLIIVLGSWLILTTINPQLLIIGLDIKGVEERGVILYTRPSCQETNDIDQPGKPGVDFQKFTTLGSWTLGDLNNRVQSIYFFEPKENLAIDLFPSESWQGVPVRVSDFLGDGEKNTCQTFAGSAESIQLIPQGPGVYLYAAANGVNTYELSNPLVLQSSSPGLGEWNNKPASVSFKKQTDGGIAKQGVVLHENDNFNAKKKGECGIMIDNSSKDQTFSVAQNIGGGLTQAVSSVTVFKQNPDLSNGGVTLCRNKECALENSQDAKRTFKFEDPEALAVPNIDSSIARGIPVLKDYKWQYQDGGVWKDIDEEMGGEHQQGTSAVENISNGYIIILFQDNKYTGNCLIVTEEVDSLSGLDFNDQADSMIIIKGQRL